MTDSATQLPHGGKQPFSGKLVIAVVSLAILTFLGILSETSLNIAYSTLMEEFSIGASVVQWLTTGTLLGALAVNFPMLLAARLVMSLGTGISLSLITSIILEKRRLNSAARCSASSVWSPALHRPSARYSAAC